MALIDTVQGWYDNVRSGKTKTRAQFVVARDHVADDASPGAPFAAQQHYFQVVVNEMFLASSRQWFADYVPMAVAAVSFVYGKAEQQTVPFVIGPALLKGIEKVPEGMIFRNTTVTGLHPYAGGAFTLTVLLNRLQTRNHAEQMLKLVEGVSSAVDPTQTLGPYLKLAGPIVDGVEALLGLDEAQAVLGYREAFNPQTGANFSNDYNVLIDADDAGIDRSRFWVKGSRLFMGSTLGAAKPYRDNDFVLFRIAQATQRNDVVTLPFYPLWEAAQDFAGQGTDAMWTEAKAQFNTLKREMNRSADLTEPDRTRLRDGYLAKLVALRTQSVDESKLSETKGFGAIKPDAGEQRLREIARQLDKLDKL